MSSPCYLRSCVVCGVQKPPESLMLCSRCKDPNYLVCSEECQKSDWQNHKTTMCNVTNLFDEIKLDQIPKMAPGNFVVIPVADPGDPLCFMYTRGLHHFNRPELLAVDVPVKLLPEIRYILGSIAVKSRDEGEKKIFHGYKTELSGLWATTLVVTKESLRRQIIKSMGTCNRSAKICLVKPLFDDWKPIPPVPKGKVHRQEAILSKWKTWRNAQGPPDESVTRKLENALLDPNRGWELCGDLTSREITLVRKHWDHFVRAGLAGLCFPPPADAYLKTVAANIHLAPQRYRRGMKVAPGHFTWDI